MVLHIGNPDNPASPKPNAVCPVWKKSNELFGQVFSYCSKTSVSSFPKLQDGDAGLLYLGIKDGWDKTTSQWTRSPALQILKEVDDLLFCHRPNMERLAMAYKSFRLLKVLRGTSDVTKREY